MTRAYTVTRTDVSPYQAENFVHLEKKLVEDLGFHYDLNAQSPQIMLTNTLTDMGTIHERFDISQVQLIIHPNSGYDNYPLSFVEKANFPIVLGNPIRAQAVVEYTLGCLMNHFANIEHRPTWDKKREFNRTLIKGKNVLVVGKGLIGSQLGLILESIGAVVEYFDPFVIKSPSLKELITHTEVLILTASLNRTSYHLINREIFSILKPNILLINPARGSLMDQKELAKFLTQNVQAFAYLDVFENEPRRDQELESLTNVCLTSHIAGVHLGLDQSILNFEKEILLNFKMLNRPSFEQKYASLLLNRRIINQELI
ncbi:MAG: hypothetical protein Fur0010_14510 [Bdellovibrio sp.]